MNGISMRWGRIRAALPLLAALLAMSGGLFAPAPVARAASVIFTVTTTADAIDAKPGDGICATATGTCSLRAALMEANAERFKANPPSLFTVNLTNGQTYSLTIAGADEDEAASGDLDIRVPMAIGVAGGGSATIAGQSRWSDRIFDVNPDAPGAQVQMTGLIITGGHATTGTASTDTSGGGILSRGLPDGTTPHRLTLTNTTVANNTAADGGGIFLDGNELILTDSTVSGNTAANVGGIAGVPKSVIAVGSVTNVPSAMAASGSTVSGNTAASSNSTGGTTGGIGMNCGATTLTNSTVSGNTATGGFGGGITSGCSFGLAGLSSHLTLHNVTVAGNVGGGVVNGVDSTTDLANTIIATNSGSSSGVGPDCDGAFNSQGFNLIGNTTDCTLNGTTTGNILNQEPRLGLLQNNGGPTQTQALLQANTSCPLKGPCPLYNPSRGIDAGNPASVGSSGVACPPTDQRGVARPLDGNGDGIARCDMGAYEAHALPNLGSFTLTPKDATARVGQHLGYSFAWTVPSGGWRSLDSLNLVLSDAQGTALWLHFHEVAGSGSTLDLIDPKDLREGPTFTFGSPNRLETNTATVYLATSSLDGPAGSNTVTLTLDLGFKSQAAGRTFAVQVLAADDAGDFEGFVDAGTLTVQPGSA